MGDVFRGESTFADVRVVRSALPEEFDEAEESWEPEFGGWFVRERTDRRGEVPAILAKKNRYLRTIYDIEYNLTAEDI